MMTQNSHIKDESGNTIPGTPGGLALRVKQELDNFEFKKPLPKMKKKNRIMKQKVLDEETFCQQVDQIIQRDFFPDVEKIKTQNAYLDAVKNNDIYSLQKIYAKYSLDNSIRTVQSSVRSIIDTPVADTLNESSRSNESSVSTCETDGESTYKSKNQSLDQFFATHISEESQNFQDIIKEEERKLKEKKPWLFVEEKQKKSTENLSLPNLEEMPAITDGSDGKLDTWDYKNKNYIMFVPDGVELSLKKKMEMAKQKLEVVHANTNFITCPYDEEHSKEIISDIAYKQSLALEGKIGVDGKAITLESPKINGFSFVKTPSPMPGVDATPFMTWGQIEGTPFKLDGSDTPRSAITGPSFKIAEQPKRERLAFQLAEKALERHRDKKRKALEAAKRQIALSSPNITRSPLNKLNLMSPAAKRLVASHLRGKFDISGSLRSSYTPKCLTPIGTPEQSSHRTSSSSRTPATPSIGDLKTPETVPITSSSNSAGGNAPRKITKTTEVQFGKRLKASDFFA